MPQMRRGRIEIIPMIDTIFFLLVFFMITWLSMVKLKGMEMTLPRRAQQSHSVAYSVTLSLSPKGAFYIGNRRISANAWQGELARDLAVHRNAVVVLNVAPEQKTQTLISVLDSVNRVVTQSQSHAQVLVATQRMDVK